MILPTRLTRSATLPRYAHPGDSGLDGAMRAWRWSYEDDDQARAGWLVLHPGGIAKAFLGVAVELPDGFEVQVRPRSGNSLRGLWCAWGTGDASYRGELSASLANVSGSPLVVNVGDRVCQLVVAPVVRVEFVEVGELGVTERGSNGFGSSGR